MKKFKKELQKEETIPTYLEHTRFVKPSAKKHRAVVHARHVRKKILEEEAIEAVKAKLPFKKKEDREED